MSIYKFRNCILHSTQRYVRRDDEYLSLTPKAFDVLLMLVERAGEVVSRDEILGKVWGGAVVEEGNLSVHISKLRRVLGDRSGERFIETVSGSGYRFIPSVELIESVSPNGNKSSYDHLSRNSEFARQYLKGKYFRKKRTASDLYKAIAYFEKAVALDPASPYPYIETVDSYRLLQGLDVISNSEALEKITPLLNALENADQNIEALHVARGNVAMFLDWRFDLAEAHYNRALELNPNCLDALYRYAELLIFSERFSEAKEHLSKIIYLDPFSLPTYIRLGRLYYLMGMYNHAEVYLRDALELEPQHREVQVILGAVLLEQNEFKEAEVMLQNCLTTHVEKEALGYLGYLYARDGRVELANQVIKQLTEYTEQFGHFDIAKARIHFLLREKEIGYMLLEDWINNHGSEVIFIRVDPNWNIIRNEDRFRRLVDQIALK